MGYTHYWWHKREFTKEELRPILFSINKIINNLPEHSFASNTAYSEYPLEIAYEDDMPTEAPEVNDICIHLNGIGELSSETFYFVFNPTEQDYDDGYSRFCKTSRQPYDYVVQAILIIINTYANDAVEIDSGGTPADWEWSLKTAREVCNNKYLVSPIK